MVLFKQVKRPEKKLTEATLHSILVPPESPFGKRNSAHLCASCLHIAFIGVNIAPVRQVVAKGKLGGPGQLHNGKPMHGSRSVVIDKGCKSSMSLTIVGYCTYRTRVISKIDTIFH